MIYVLRQIINTNISILKVVENGAVQTFPSQTNDYKKFNGVSQPVTKDINQSDSFFTTKHESKPIICLENGFSPNLDNGDISRTLPIPSDDNFFHSSLPTVKDDLIVSGFNDSVSDLYHDYRSSFNQLDGVNVGCNGNDNNDMVPDLLANNEKDDDFDDDNWEFKDAPSDMFNDNMAQNKVLFCTFFQSKSIINLEEKIKVKIENMF